MKRLSFAVLFCLVISSLPMNAASPVVISEFMSSTFRNLRDETGQYPDWIEIQNVSSNTVNLLNWSLTDDDDNLTKWRFPETNLNAGAFMIIYAASPEQRVPGAPLRTGFSLSAEGEYLALVDPNGVIATEYSADFRQAPDVSFGLARLTTNTVVVTTNSAVRVRVPANGNDGTNWTLSSFDDSAWTAGINGVGYGTTNATAADYSAVVSPTAPVGFWRLNESSGTTAANLGSGAGLSGTYSSATLGVAGPRPPQFNGFEANNSCPTFNGTSSYVGVNSSLLSGRGAFTVGGWVRQGATQLARTGLFGQNDCVEFGFISAGTLQCWTPGGGSVDAPVTLSLNTWYHIVAVGNGSNIRIFTNGVLAATGGIVTTSYGTSASSFNIGGNGVFDATGNFFNGQIDEVVAYHRALSVTEIQALYNGGLVPAIVAVTPYVKTDIGTVMSNVNASAYIRLPFNVENPTNVAQLILRVRYDDGFVAYINGIPVVSANAPESMAFNSSATAGHSPGTVEEFRFSNIVLQPGANMLAIQGLNLAAADEDFLVVAELTATSVLSESPIPLYFTTPTPGAENIGGVANPGPAILDVAHAPNVPSDSEDIFVTARIQQTFAPVAGVVMRYRVMFDPELEVTMFDDGAHGDSAAGDGIYGAAIPASAATTGQMVRWFVRSTDTAGRTSRWPIFANPTRSAEYLGTVVSPDYIASKLPIYHLFAPETVLDPAPPTSQVGADSEAGGKVAVFYDGEFYDNVTMELRGNTSATQQKKSHRLEFNPEHPFRHSPDHPRVRKTSLMAEFLDPAYIRQLLSFWLLDQMGVRSPFFYPVRAQLNGSFYGLVFHNDVIDEEQVARMGYDPAGALYKAIGNALPSESSTGVFQKKSPPPLTDHTDYQTLVRAINETNTVAGRRAAAFDMLDIPQVINYLAGARWCAENDDVWANMSIYRDTFGDGLWRNIPFDMNASWGQRYGGITPLDAINDNCKSHPLYGGSTIIACDGGTYNRIYDVIIAMPETRQMLLRRQRTVLDRWVIQPGLPPEMRLLDNHIKYMTNLIWTEAFMDRQKWGFSTWVASNKYLTNAVDELFTQFINLRRTHWSVTHCITNVAKPIGITSTSNAGIPLSQPTNATVLISSVEFTPSSGNQAQEFITVTNPNPYALDISGWKLDGGIEFTFHPGTIMPSNGVLYVSPDVKAFRARTVGPRGGQGLFVVGPYKGQLSARGESLIIADDKGRRVTTNVYVGAPSLAQQFLRITEIMYNPAPLAGNPNDAQEFEFIELKNISGSVTLDLTGVRFINGIEFNFTGSAVTSLAPGARVIVVKNPAVFAVRYGGGLPVAGAYSGNLDNNGERLQLVDALGEEILDFDFEDDWYAGTDGVGFSLVVVNENAEPDLWNSKLQWRLGGSAGGAPGQTDPLPTTVAPIVISEVLTHTDLPQVDVIELHNPTASPVNVGGWFLSDDFGTAKKFRIPDNTIIPANDFVFFTEEQFNPFPGVPPSFAFSSSSDEAYLFSGNGTEVTGYVQGYSFGGAENGVSFGRYIDSQTNVHFVAQSTTSIGAANAGPKVGPVVISEVMYHPVDGANGSENSDEEYIELRNITGSPVPLFNPAFPASTWRMRGGVDFDFPANVTLPANGSILLVSFSTSGPGSAPKVAAFRAHYGVPESQLILGPYSGQLNNADDEIRIEKPNDPEFGLVSHFVVDRLDYRDTAPWPAAADGSGASLQRLSLSQFSNDPINWTAGAATAGGGFTGGTAPVITAQPVDRNGLALQSVTFNVSASGSGPLRYQWRFNGATIDGATNSLLMLNNLQFEQAGLYSVVVYNGAGAEVSADATLSVLLPAYFTLQPVGRAVYIKPDAKAANLPNGTNVTFVATGFSDNSAFTYQWRFNGIDIPGETGPSITITNVQLEDEGDYTCAITDSIGTVVSAPARLVPWVSPIIQQVSPPITAAIPGMLYTSTVPAGATIYFSASIFGNPPPYGYIWRSNSLTLGTVVSDSQTNVFAYTTRPTPVSSLYRVIVTNAAQPNVAAGVWSAQFYITTLADNDQDGIPDSYEVANGFDTNNAADALGDADEDGMSNRAEYQAGTDPANHLSYLRVELEAQPGAASVEVAAVASRNYTVQYTDALGTGMWHKLGDVFARATNRVETIADPGWNSNRFYRVVLPQLP